MSESAELLTTSADETRAVGEVVGAMLLPGDVVSLTGDLGAGKTTFVQGAARALKVEQPVVSPTFTLIREYSGVFPVFHVDVYRLDNLGQVQDLGFDELLDRGGVVFVEWGDAIEALLPESYLRVQLTLPTGGDSRAILLSGSGGTSGDRWRGVVEAVTRWKEA